MFSFDEFGTMYLVTSIMTVQYQSHPINITQGFN